MGFGAPSCSPSFCGDADPATFYMFGKDASFPVKLGLTRNLENRLRSLTNSCPYRLEILLRIEFKSFEMGKDFEDSIKAALGPWKTDGGTEWRILPVHIFNWATLLSKADALAVLDYGCPGKYGGEIPSDRKTIFEAILKEGDAIQRAGWKMWANVQGETR